MGTHFRNLDFRIELDDLLGFISYLISLPEFKNQGNLFFIAQFFLTIIFFIFNFSSLHKLYLELEI